MLGGRLFLVLGYNILQTGFDFPSLCEAKLASVIKQYQKYNN